MSPAPVVSVVIPVYNAAATLPATLACFRDQTLRDIEIIAVDDGSTDNSLSILRNTAAEDDRFSFVSQPHQNAGAARNTGIEQARGDYLFFFDADDLLSADTLERAVTKLQDHDADICVMGFSFCSDTDEAVGTTPPTATTSGEHFVRETHEHLEKIFQSTITSVWNKVYRRSLITENSIFFQSIQRTNDLSFNALSLIYSRRIAYLRDQLIWYRSGQSSSLQATVDQTPTDPLRALARLHNDLVDRGKLDLCRRSFYQLVVDIVRYAGRRLKTTSARETYKDALCEWLGPELGLMDSINELLSDYPPAQHCREWLRTKRFNYSSTNQMH